MRCGVHVVAAAEGMGGHLHSMAWRGNHMPVCGHARSIQTHASTVHAMACLHMMPVQQVA